jgi:penicillin-binding protein 2B
MLTEYQQGAQITLRVSSEAGTTVIVPNLSGMTIQNVNQTLTALGLVLSAEGGGIAVEQSIPKDTAVQKGTTINVKFKYVE